MIPGREELREEIDRLVEELGRIPTQIDVHEHCTYSKAPFIRVFGSWNEAVKEAGYEPNRD